MQVSLLILLPTLLLGPLFTNLRYVVEAISLREAIRRRKSVFLLDIVQKWPRPTPPPLILDIVR